MAIDNYTTLKAAVISWMEGSAAVSGEADNFIQLAEVAFNRRLGGEYRRITTATITTDSDGEATLPTGFVLMRELRRDISGSNPLTPTSWAALTAMDPYNVGGDPDWYAIRGTILRVRPVVEDDFIATYERTLVGLSGSNASNWLLETAPDAYLFMCMAQGHLFNENWDVGGALEAKALGLLSEVVGQGVVAQFGNAEIVLSGPTP